MHIFVYRAYRIVWMEYVRSGRIVDDDDLLQLPAEFVKILDVIAPMEDTAFAK